MRGVGRTGDRRSIRLEGFDYSTRGAYFITVCTQDRACLFGEVSAGVIRQDPLGEIVQDVWVGLADHYEHIETGPFIVMPDHFHGIIHMTDVRVGAGFKPAPLSGTRQHALPEIVRAFKTFSARQINVLRGTSGRKVWQRGYHEHIIRDEREWVRIRDYIDQNPAKWGNDTVGHPTSL